ncbi:MAG: metal ABC transporter ATP-binding protein [Chloroflexi bacterium]|nr:metal ABC transporter ATP-binding protein [Chloroflexota bacterium]
MDDTPAVELEDVSFTYAGSPAVHGVTLRIERGDFTAIVGPNGSGKSTLLKIILGLIKPDNGQVRVFGTDIERFKDWRRIGYVPQVATGIHAMFPITVSEVVAHGRYSGFSPFDFWRRGNGADVDGVLQMVDMADFKRRRIGELSTGQQQRALIARALIRKPELLVMDEPIAGVDVQGGEELYMLLRQLRAQGVTILIISHDVGAVMREAGTVACMNCTLLCHCPPQELTEDDLVRLYGFPVEVLHHGRHHDHHAHGEEAVRHDEFDQVTPHVHRH